MSLWAQKRQLTYASVVVFIVLLGIALPLYFIFIYHPASCFDGVQNQGEEGIDCGGPCSKVCASDAQAPVVHFQRFFEVTPGVYSVVALVENPNISTFADNVPYDFRLYDSNGVVIAERTGTTFMLPNTVFPIFESNLQTGARTAVRASFSFTGPTPNWQKKTYILPNLVVTNQILSAASSTATTSPRLDATLQNDSDYTVSNVEVVALLYDATGNAVGASDTIVNSIAPRLSTALVYTWPQNFSTPVTKIVITPKIYPIFNQ